MYVCMYVRECVSDIRVFVCMETATFDKSDLYFKYSFCAEHTYARTHERTNTHTHTQGLI